MVVMTTPDMEAALMPVLGVSLPLHRSGIHYTSLTRVRPLLESLVLDVCYRTLLALLRSFWFLLISDGNLGTMDKFKGMNTQYRPSRANAKLAPCEMDTASVKDNMKGCFELWKGITNLHHVADMRPEESFVLAINSKARPFSNDMEEENESTERCSARRYEAIEGLNTDDIFPGDETASWMLAAKNKDDDEEDEDDDEEDEDEDDYGEDEDEDGEGGDEEEEDEDGGAGGNNRDADKEGDDDDGEEDEEGDYEDEDDEDVDEESSSEEDETPPKKLRK